MKERPPACPGCGHPLHMHTSDRDGSHKQCWHEKYAAGEWPCRCGQPAEQLELSTQREVSHETVHQES